MYVTDTDILLEAFRWALGPAQHPIRWIQWAVFKYKLVKVSVDNKCGCIWMVCYIDVCTRNRAVNCVVFEVRFLTYVLFSVCIAYMYVFAVCNFTFVAVIIFSFLTPNVCSV
jgi:hypothetical protein